MQDYLPTLQDCPHSDKFLEAADSLSVKGTFRN